MKNSFVVWVEGKVKDEDMAAEYHILPQNQDNTPKKSCAISKRKGILLVICVIVLVMISIYTLYRPNHTSLSDYRTDLSSEYNQAKHRLPQCIIIGMRKGGTRALLHFLSLHPDIQVSAKEVHYFDKNDNFFQGLSWYKKNLPLSYGDQLTIEKTPGYFHNKEAPERVFRFNSTIKLILIVRDPIERAVSDHLQLMEKKAKKGQETSSFEEMVIKDNGEINEHYKPIERSVYYVYMKQWLKFFQLEQILIIDGQKLTKSPFEVIQKVESYLGLGHKVHNESFVFDRTKGFFCIKNETTGHKCLNKTKGRKHPEIDKEARSKLKQYFQPYNQMFFEQIGLTLNW